MAVFGRHQFGGVGVDNIVGRRHHAVLHQHLDDVHGAPRHAVGEIGNRDGFRNDDVAGTGGAGGGRVGGSFVAPQRAAVGGGPTPPARLLSQGDGGGAAVPGGGLLLA